MQLYLVMTIRRTQGLTTGEVLGFSKEPVLNHGRLYVASTVFAGP